MRLTKKKAIEISIELWTWLVETGRGHKQEWDGWDKYGEMVDECALCEFSRNGCSACPLELMFGGCKESFYDNWRCGATTKSRKKYARLFLEQLYQLKGEK